MLDEFLEVYVNALYEAVLVTYCSQYMPLTT